MQGKDPIEQLLFDLKIERTTCRIIKEKTKVRLLDLEENFVLKQENIAEVDNNNNQNNNNNNGKYWGHAMPQPSKMFGTHS